MRTHPMASGWLLQYIANPGRVNDATLMLTYGVHVNLRCNQLSRPTRLHV